MLHISAITSLQTDTYIDELLEMFLKLSMKTLQVHLIIWTTLCGTTEILLTAYSDAYEFIFRQTNYFLDVSVQRNKTL